MPSTDSVSNTPALLPPPSTLFGSSLFDLPPPNSCSESRPLFILPPPSSLLGFHPTSSFALPHAHEHAPAVSSAPPSAEVLKPLSGLHLPSPKLAPPVSAAARSTSFSSFSSSASSAAASASFSSSASTSSSAERLGTKRREPSPDSTQRKRRDIKKAKDHDDVNMVAATLASFAQSTTTFQHTPPTTPPLGLQAKRDTCQDDECAGQGTFGCPECGTTYQHANCLQRHRWEHADGWSEIQGRLDMTKRQQAQLLEAAQILMDISRCGMRVGMV